MIWFFTPGVIFSQVITADSYKAIVLDSGYKVGVFQSKDCPQCYYYLPVDLRVSQKPGGIPEISLVTWKNDEGSEVIGGILHLLVEWGLTPEKERLLGEVIRSRYDSSAIIMGSVLVNPGTMKLSGSDKACEILRTSLTNPPAVPSTPGAKMALSFHISQTDILDFLEFTNHPAKTKGELILYYQYEALSPFGAQEIKDLELRLPISQLLKLIKT